MPEWSDAPLPQLEELQQREYEEETPLDHRLDVRVDEITDPVRVHLLPAKHAILQSMTINSTEVATLFTRDIRRSRALIWAEADTVEHLHISTRKDEVESGTAAQMIVTDGTVVSPQPLELYCCDAVYARTFSGLAVVSFLLEYWAD